MKARAHRRFARKETTIGFQIAPMIDVVFVILLFFMVAAGARQRENANMMEMPSDNGAISLPDEVIISIEENGQVYLNDDPMDDSGVKDLKQLAKEMTGLMRASKEAGAQLLVTIQPEESVKYERVVNVLDALTRANVKGVTFQTVDK